MCCCIARLTGRWLSCIWGIRNVCVFRKIDQFPETIGNQGYLVRAEMNIPVHIVFENKCRGMGGAMQEPGES